MIFKNKSSKKSIEQAKQIVNDQLIVHPLWEAVSTKHEIDWNQDPFNNRTWCYYLHSLSPVNYLMNAYEYEKQTIYIDKAKEIINSWEENNSINSQFVSEYAWKDHSTANRVVAIIYFWSNYIHTNLYEKKFEKRLMSLLERHGEFLYDNDNYNFRNNHGVYQDRALIELATIFPELHNSKLWYERAIDRLMNYVEKFVSNEGVHKEHSAAYHILMLRLLGEIDEFLSYYNRGVPELHKIIHKMEEYLAYVVKPNGIIPMTGDSGPDSIFSIKGFNFNNPKLLYVRSNGSKGEKTENEIVYREDGVAIFRNEWGKNIPLYINFTAAFHSLAHKHADDLSVLLTIGKTDFFVDSGKYNYQEKDEFRKYFRSTLAHNVVTMNRKSYELKPSQAGKSRITKYGIKNEYSFVVGTHELYPGVKMKRTLIHLKNFSSVLVHDELESPKMHTYSQIFNIGKDVEVTPVTKKKILLKSTIENNQIELLQVNHVTEFKNYKGETDPIAGWQSTAFNEKHAITQLQFSNKGDNIEYKSIINLDTSSNNGVKNYTLKRAQNDEYTIICKDNSRFSFKLKDN
ncbi:heparinase II/III domain-containing protein [Gracilibacillus phocaeensis]|uniref:heparinase II/III domain-containing protein n=1 Tax=Gracilibacillus phocaeensis TaxID=2042304 RepID=UPI001031646D|nr:heparinase II/III family protein [Gracilibacillus phocaeensis]